MRVMKQSVEERGDGRGVTKEFAPVVDVGSPRGIIYLRLSSIL